MEDKNKKKCSSKNLSDIDAIYYCPQCKIYICRKCENSHSVLFQSHNIYNLEKNKEDIFSEYCKEVGHFEKLLYFCKSHNQLCCVKCISKIKGEGNGQHSECEINLLKDVKDVIKNKLNENMKYLEDISKNIIPTINELKKLLDKINKNKENIKKQIQKIFTRIRNALNDREDYLLDKIDEIYNKIYFDENTIKYNEKFPDKIKLSLDKGKKIEQLWNDDKMLISLINDCLNIENNIKDIININETLKKNKNSENIEIKFYPEEDKIDNLLNYVKTYGNIFIRGFNNNNNLIKNNLSINQNNNILLISNGKYKTLYNLLKFIRPINKIEVKSPESIIPNLKYDNIKNSKIIIFDLQDSGYGGYSYNNINEVKNYLINGGNIIVTHDHWSFLRNKAYPELFGAKLKRQQYVFVKKVKILNNLHPVFTSFYQINLENNSIIDIASTHKTDTIYENIDEYNKDILMELEDGKRGEYLLIKEIGKGKLIFWNSGHSFNNCAFEDLTDFEKKLFINFIYFILS